MALAVALAALPNMSMLHEQTSSIPSMPTASLSRQFPTSVLSHEPRDECRASLSTLRGDRTYQSQSTMDRKKIEDRVSIDEYMGTSGQYVGDFENQLSHLSGLSYLLQSLEDEECLPSSVMDEPMEVRSSVVVSLAKEALSASKLALSIAESPDESDADLDEPNSLGADFDESISPRSRDTSTVKQKRVRSTRLLERRLKKRRSPKPVMVDKTDGSERVESRRSSEGFTPNDPLRLFLGPETKQLLTVQEENELIREVQDFNKLIDVKRNLQSQFDREPTFSEWADAVGLSSRVLRSEFHSWKRSREKLIYSNFRMVVYIARQYQGRGLSLQDLLQEGSMGLMKSVEKFKPQAGCRFPSYAYWWIRQSIRKAIFLHSRTIRLPENMYGLLSKVLEAKRLYIQEGHYYPTPEELAGRLGITVKKLQNLFFLMRNPLSMQQSVWADQDTTFQEVTADTKVENPDVCVEKQLMRKHVRNLLGSLTPREQEVIKLRYGIGLDSGKRFSLSEIGTKFELSKERVRQIESRALNKLKQSLNSHGLKAYTD